MNKRCTKCNKLIHQSWGDSCKCKSSIYIYEGESSGNYIAGIDTYDSSDDSGSGSLGSDSFSGFDGGDFGGGGSGGDW